MRNLSYRFSLDFPARYLPLARASFQHAAKAWAASGVVQFGEVSRGPEDIIIRMADIPAQECADDHQTKKPWMTTNRELGRITVNSLISWQSSKWQFWRFIWQPEIFAHEIGHILFDTSAHSHRIGSVMHYTAQWMPDELDLALLRTRMADKRHTVG